MHVVVLRHAGSMSWSAMISGMQCTTGKLARLVASGSLISTTSLPHFSARTNEGQGMQGIADRLKGTLISSDGDGICRFGLYA